MPTMRRWSARSGVSMHGPARDMRMIADYVIVYTISIFSFCVTYLCLVHLMEKCLRTICLFLLLHLRHFLYLTDDYIEYINIENNKIAQITDSV